MQGENQQKNGSNQESGASLERDREGAAPPAQRKAELSPQKEHFCSPDCSSKGNRPNSIKFSFLMNSGYETSSTKG